MSVHVDKKTRVHFRINRLVGFQLFMQTGNLKPGGWTLVRPTLISGQGRTKVQPPGLLRYLVKSHKVGAISLRQFERS